MEDSNDFNTGGKYPLNILQGKKGYDCILLIEVSSNASRNANIIRNVVETLTNYLEDLSCRVGVLFYNDNCSIADNRTLTLTNNINAWKKVIDILPSDPLEFGGGANLGNALQKAKEMLKNTIEVSDLTRNILFIISDGLDNHVYDALAIARDLRREGNLIATIGLSENANTSFLREIANPKCSTNYVDSRALTQSFQRFMDSIYNDADVSVSIYFTHIYSVGEDFTLTMELKNLRGEKFDGISIEFINNAFIKGTTIIVDESLEMNKSIDILCRIEVQDRAELKQLVTDCSLQFLVKSEQRDLHCTHDRVFLSPFMFMKNIVLHQSKYTRGMHFLLTGRNSSGKSSLNNYIHRVFSQNEDTNPSIVGTASEVQSKTEKIENYRINCLTDITLRNYIQFMDKWGFVLNVNDDGAMHTTIADECFALKNILYGMGKPGDTVHTYSIGGVVPLDQVDAVNTIDIVLFVIDVNDILLRDENRENEESLKRKKNLIDVLSKLVEIISKFRWIQYAVVITKTDTLPNVSSLDFFNPDSKIYKDIVNELVTNSTFGVDVSRIFCLSNQVSGQGKEKWINEFRQGATVMNMIEFLQTNYDVSIKNLDKNLLQSRQELNSEYLTTMTARFSFDEDRFAFASKLRKPGIRKTTFKINKNDEQDCLNKIRRLLQIQNGVGIKFKVDGYLVPFRDLFEGSKGNNILEINIEVVSPQ